MREIECCNGVDFKRRMNQECMPLDFSADTDFFNSETCGNIKCKNFVRSQPDPATCRLGRINHATINLFQINFIDEIFL